jgi:hypothetical protein
MRDRFERKESDPHFLETSLQILSPNFFRKQLLGAIKKLILKKLQWIQTGSKSRGDILLK